MLTDNSYITGGKERLIDVIHFEGDSENKQYSVDKNKLDEKEMNNSWLIKQDEKYYKVRSKGENYFMVSANSFSGDINILEKISMWTLTALRHDLGYPLEKSKKILAKTENMMEAFVSQANINGPQKPIANPNNANGNTIQSGHSIFSTPQTEEYKELVKAKIKELQPITENGKDKKLTLKINGIDMEFLCYRDKNIKFGGYNQGFYVYNEKTNELCWLKSCGEQSQIEEAASKLYTLAGIPSAQMELCLLGDSVCTLSRYLPKLQEKFPDEKKSLLSKGYAMDALLANRDAVTSHNAQISEMDNEVYRIDFGAAFDFGGAGGHNPQKFHSIPTEISSLLNPQYKCPNGGSNAEMYSALTREDLISSLESICQVDDNEMAKVLQHLIWSNIQIYYFKEKQV